MEARRSFIQKLGLAVRNVFTTTFFLVWLIGWTLGTIGIDARCVTTIWRQTVSTAYPSVTGTVIISEKVPKVSSKGSHYDDARFRYAYEVGGRRYESDRKRFDSERGYVPLRWVTERPVGSTVRVFYDPKNPADAALETGVTGGDLAWPIVAIVFTFIAYIGDAAMLIWAWGGVRWLIGAGPRTPVRRRGDVVVPGGQGWLAQLGLFGLLFKTFLLALVVIGVVAGRGVGAWVMTAFWAVVLYGMLRLAKARMKWGWRMLEREIEIDTARRVVRLPAEAKDEGLRYEVPFDRVVALELQMADSAREIAILTLRWRGATDERRSVVHVGYDRAEAERVRDASARTIGVPTGGFIDRPPPPTAGPRGPAGT
jgi:hypothetical protein